MGNYRWDGGSKRKFFDDSLPTDSAVSFLLALYTKKIEELFVWIALFNIL